MRGICVIPIKLFFILATFTFLIILPQDSFGQVNTPVNFYSSGTGSTNSEIVSEGNNVYVMWRNDRAAGNDLIYFRSSSDNGNTWNPPLNQTPRIISDNLDDAKVPVMAADGDNVYIVWNEGDDLKLRFSTDGGDSFGSSQVFSNGNFQIRPNIAVQGNTVYIVWIEDRSSPTRFVAMFTKFTDNLNFSTLTDLSFGHAISISQGVNTANQPQIAISGNRVHVAWIGDHSTPNNSDRDNEVFTISSSNRGDTFSAVSNMSEDDTTGGNSFAMGANGADFFVMYEESGNIFVRWNLSDGTNPQSKIQLTTDGGRFKMDAIVVNGLAHLVWVQQNFLPTDVLEYTRQVPLSLNFASLKELGTSVSRSEDPRLSASGNAVMVTYRELLFQDEVNYSINPDNGSTFTTPVSLGSSQNTAKNQKSSISGDKVYAIWSEVTPFSTPFEQLFFNSATVTCQVPVSEDWTISSSCTLDSDATAPRNVIVKNGAVLTIASGVTLDIDFSQFNLTVESGGGVLIKSGGKIT